jgi:hypothetical protein
LETRVVNPAFADAFVEQPVNVLEQQQPNHETGLDPRPALVAVERCDLADGSRAPDDDEKRGD